MAKAKKKNKEEAAGAVSSTPGDPACINCAFSNILRDRLVCGIELPPFVKRSDRASDYIVHNDHVCALHKSIQ